MSDVDTSGLTDILAQLQQRGTNLQPALRIAGEALKAAVLDVYDAEGPGWPDLTGETLAGRRKPKGTKTVRIEVLKATFSYKKLPRGSKGGRKAPASHKILQDTGIMKGSTGVELGSNYAEASAGVDYAQYHVEGSRHLPVRDPFNLGPFEEPMLEEVAAMLLSSVSA